MKQYKYYIKHFDEFGNIIFFSRSDSASALITRYNKAAFFSDGNMSSRFFSGRHESNITPEIEYRVSCGEKI